MTDKSKQIFTEEGFSELPLVDTSVELTVRGEIGKTTLDKLMRLYGDVTVNADGEATPLSKIKSAKEIVVPAMPLFSKERYNAVDAVRVIDRLIRPGDGCPWDSVQTHESIRINMIEEAYEAVDAIDRKDVANMREEFGDVLLQSLLQSAIARKNGEFDFDDVCDELCKKLIGRHTFIFGADSANDPNSAIDLWEKNKATEKHYASVKEQLQRMPQNFPSLLTAQKAYKKAKKAGKAKDAAEEFEAAVKARDYVGVIAACAALLSDAGEDAEAELNKRIKSKIDEL